MLKKQRFQIQSQQPALKEIMIFLKCWIQLQFNNMCKWKQKKLKTVYICLGKISMQEIHKFKTRNSTQKHHIDYMSHVLADSWNSVSEGLKLSLCSEHVVLTVAWECAS